MLSTMAFLAAEGEQLHELPMSPYAFGGIALALFALLLATLWAFRGTAQRWSGITLHDDHATDADGHDKTAHH